MLAVESLLEPGFNMAYVILKFFIQGLLVLGKKQRKFCGICCCSGVLVNYNTSEFRFSIKGLLLQELTLEEMKNSNIYKAYNQIDHDTNVEEVNRFLNKKSKNIYEHFESWYYPYGYVSIRPYYPELQMK